MFRSALLTLTKCLASTGLKTSTYLLPCVFRDFISVHQHTACLMGGSTSSCVSVWYAAGDELVQQEPRKGSERNDLSGWYLKNDVTLLFCSQQQGASRSFTSTRNTHTQLTGHRQTRNLCFYGRTEGPVCVLSSCLANTQLYMADTERERRVSWRTSFCSVVWSFCLQ